MADPVSLPKLLPAAPPPAVPPAGGARAGVPVTVWPAIPLPGPCPSGCGPVPCPRRWTAAAAGALIAALSRAGDLVAVPLPGDAVFTAAAVAAARRVAGPAPDQRPQNGQDAAHASGPVPGSRSPSARSAAGAGLAALAVVTDCPACGPPSAGDAGGHVAGPLPYAACRRLVRPGGLLAVLTGAARDPGRTGRVIAGARAAGLVYAQHVIAVHAPVHGDRLASPWSQPGAAIGLAHLPVHTDLVLFASPEGTRHD